MPQISPMKWIFLSTLMQTLIVQTMVVTFSYLHMCSHTHIPAQMKTMKISWKW